MLIETEGLGAEGLEVILDMKQTYEQGREQNRLNVGFNDTADWIYKKTTKEARPTLTRQSEVAVRIRRLYRNPAVSASVPTE